MHVLITGFGPFLDHRQNPSDRLARALDDRYAGPARLKACSPLPVELGRAAQRALRAVEHHNACAVVAFGLAAGARRIRLERRALNRSDSRAPDNAGVVGAGRAVIPGAPFVRRATIPLEPIRAALWARSIASETSDDAGGYVCNDLYYRLLHAGVPALFVHVPHDVQVERVAAPLSQGIGRAVIASSRDDLG